MTINKVLKRNDSDGCTTWLGLAIVIPNFSQFFLHMKNIVRGS
jgi:hypothetical protein